MYKFLLFALFSSSSSLNAMEPQKLRLRTTDGKVLELSMKELDALQAWYYRDLFEENGTPIFAGSDKECKVPFDYKTFKHYQSYMNADDKRAQMKKLTPMQRSKLVSLIDFLIIPRTKKDHIDDKEMYARWLPYMEAPDKELYIQNLTPKNRQKLFNILSLSQDVCAYDSRIIDDASQLLIELTEEKGGNALLLPGLPEGCPPVEMILRQKLAGSDFDRLQSPELTGHTGWVNAAAFSPDGKSLASGSNDETIRLWDVATGAPLRTLKGHTGWVRAVAFSPDGKSLASGSDDKTIRLWDPATGAPLDTLTGHTSWVEAVAFSPDGKSLASGSDDRTVRLWDTESDLASLDSHQLSFLCACLQSQTQNTKEFRQIYRSLPPEIQEKIDTQNDGAFKSDM